MIAAGLSAAGLESLIARHRLDLQQATRLVRLQLRLAHEAPVGRLRINRNRRTMLSLRGRPAAWTVSLHVGLLDHDAVVSEIPGWVNAHGRSTSPALRHLLQVAWQQQQERCAVRAGDAALSSGLETLAGPCLLEREFARVHATWFAHLPPPPIGWSRTRRHRNVSCIRFGSYRRLPRPMVLINPRLDQPWVARVFVDHVLFHELCHHAQACAPMRGEAPHSPRFRAWERAYPHHHAALAWERANLKRLLGPVGGPADGQRASVIDAGDDDGVRGSSRSDSIHIDM